MARSLARAGAHFILNGRDRAKLGKFEQEMRAENFSVEGAAFDVRDAARMRTYFAGLPRLDILVNNAVL